MKQQGCATPEERKAILKQIFHALRQSPMFSNYSVDHIRDSAIKSEQLTYDRSTTRQEYMQAMHSKLMKIEKSYVMNSQDILRELSQKNKQKSYDRGEHGAYGIREGGEGEKEFLPIGSTGERSSGFAYGAGVPRGETGGGIRRIDIGGLVKEKDVMHGGPLQDSLGGSTIKVGTPRVIGGLDPFSMPLGRYSIGLGSDGGEDPMECRKMDIMEGAEMPRGMEMRGYDVPGRITQVKGRLGMDIEKYNGMPPMSISGLHRVGAAGSTNTATKLNSSRFFRHPERPPKTTPVSKSVPLPTHSPLEALKHSPAESSLLSAPADLKKEEPLGMTQSMSEEVEKMCEVVEVHRKAFPRWEAQRCVFEELQKTLQTHVEDPYVPKETLQGIIQEMKKHVIVLSAELKQFQHLTFRKRVSRISKAYLQRQKTDPEYLFLGDTKKDTKEVA